MKRAPRNEMIVLTTALILSVSALAQDRVFVVEDPAGRDTVRFVLDAPFEVINGITNTVKGRIQVKGNKVSGSFSVPVSSLKTGIEKRDQHLQNEKWLNAAKFPNIIFEFKGIKFPKSVESGQTTKVVGEGFISVHGKRRKEKVALDLHYFPESDLTRKRLPGNLMRIKGTFSIRLADYGIAQSDSKIKALIGLKVGEKVDIFVDFMATDQGKSNKQ